MISTLLAQTQAHEETGERDGDRKGGYQDECCGHDPDVRDRGRSLPCGRNTLSPVGFATADALASNVRVRCRLTRGFITKFNFSKLATNIQTYYVILSLIRF